MSSAKQSLESVPLAVTGLAWAVDVCRKAALRMTPTRDLILGYLARQQLPVNLDTIAQSEELRGRCDPTTIYRTLMLFASWRVVRQVNVRHKIRSFVLNAPGGASDYLICPSCGSVSALPALPFLLELEKQVSKKGYTAVYHDLELYGICPACQAGKGGVRPSSKMPIRVPGPKGLRPLPRQVSQPARTAQTGVRDAPVLHPDNFIVYSGVSINRNHKRKSMRSKRMVKWVLALCLSALALQGQEAVPAEKLNQQLKEMQEKFEKQQREMRESFEKLVREQQAQIDALKKQLDTSKAGAAPGAPGAVTSQQLTQLNERIDQVVEAQKKVRPSEFNPSIGLVGETVFSYRTKGSDQTGSERPGGFDVFQRSVELNVAASVDPFAKAYAVINAEADSATGEASLGVEEAALQTTSLPWNLELKAGRFFGEFGRLAYIHDHELPFVNRPLALDQYLGGESKTDGLQVNWLLPMPHYVSLTGGVGDQFGDDPNNPGTFRHFSEMNFWGRASTYFELSPDWQLETGLSGLWNPKTEGRGGVLVRPNGVSTLTERERRLAGWDLKLSYVPLRNNQFRSLTWGTEVLYSDNRYLFDPDGVPANGDEFKDTVGSLGLYSYVTYKWHRQWSAGFLFDWVQSAQNHGDKTLAYSPYLTWALSHWHQLRLQYTHTDHQAVSGLRSDDAIYLQWAWIIGSHAHGWQQR